ncbi:MAG: hypothetical protein JNL17_00530 [Cyclobacteriaceae bacterium]|nr:hypothetical protein [Cyclobacteriaceae bacterium]
MSKLLQIVHQQPGNREWCQPAHDELSERNCSAQLVAASQRLVDFNNLYFQIMEM